MVSSTSMLPGMIVEMLVLRAAVLVSVLTIVPADRDRALRDGA